MATTLRALKPQPDEFLVEEKVKELERDYGGKVNFQQFLDVLHNIIQKAKKKKRKRVRVLTIDINKWYFSYRALVGC